MEQIVVGVDGSESAFASLEWAVRLAEALDGELIVTTVVEPGAVSEWRAPAVLAQRPFRTLVLEGDPRTVLLEAAAAEHADVLVLGSTATGWFPALHLGHVVHAVAQHCDRPVVVVPRGGRSAGLSVVVVGADGSPGSAAAVDWSGHLAHALRGEIVVVHVHLPVVSAGTRQDAPSWRVELETQAGEWIAPLRASEVPTRLVIMEGSAASTIAEVAADERAGILVLGARGAGGFRDLRLGSVALQLLDHAQVPVAIVPSD